MPQNNSISNDVYEELKLLCATGGRCTLQFRASNGGLTTVETQIRDVFEDGNGRFLLGDNGFVLSMDQLVAVNGRPLEPLT